jgi:sugar fermentation stimulation protein A
LLVPGRSIWIAQRAGAGRRTACDLVLVEHHGIIVAVDSRLANKVVQSALLTGAMAHFASFSAWRSEVRLGTSRIDFGSCDVPGACYVEAKCVTLVEDARALFPDAPTLRGARHLRELTASRASGSTAGVVFIVQREDALAFAPNQRADPQFCDALRAAEAAGVIVAAYRCAVTAEGVTLADPLPIEIEG